MSKIVVLIGKSGSGKSTIAKAISKTYGIEEVVSSTTREPTGRIENYNFLTREDFEKDMKAGTVVENVEFAGNLYWTNENDFSTDKPLIFVAEPTGAQQLKDNLKHKNVIRVYLACDTGVCIDRMLSRGDFGEAISNRITNDKHCFSNFECDRVIDVTHLSLLEVVDKVISIVK